MGSKSAYLERNEQNNGSQEGGGVPAPQGPLGSYGGILVPQEWGKGVAGKPCTGQCHWARELSWIPFFLSSVSVILP